MRRHVGHLALVSGLIAAVAPAAAQTPPPPATPAIDPSLGITVTATRLDEARSSIQPSLGATVYDFSKRTIENVPQGENAPLNQVLLRAPGVVQDSFGQIHVRGDHGNVQYRLDGVQLPEGLSLFNNILATRYANQMSLLTGALPAQYGLQTAGIVDIALKSGTTDPGAEVSITGGSRDYSQPAFSYGGRTGAIDYFAAGQYIHNGLGIENPTASFSPIHDDTDQWYGLAKITGIVDENTRLAFIAGGASSRFQIPNVPFQTANFAVNGQTDFNSSILDQRQWEKSYFAIASLQKSYQDVNFQLSGFARYSSLSYQPDPSGDLAFNGIAPWTKRTSFATGVQGDGSWKVHDKHTLRGGFLIQRERATSYTQGNTLPLVPSDPDDPTSDLVPSDQPFGFTDSSDLTGWTYSVYLQDEWRIVPTVTVNFGLRFDAINAATQENQFSPRINVVWQPNEMFTFRAGYSRYFTPPPLIQVSANSIATLAGTVAAPEVTTNDPGEGRARRLFRCRRHRQAPARPDGGSQRLLQDRPEPFRRRPVRRPHLAHLVQLRQFHRQGRRVQCQLRRGPVVGLFQRRLRQRHRHQHQLGAVQFRPGRARLHRQQLHHPRPQPGLDDVERRRLHLQPRQGLGDPRVGRHAVRQRPAHQRRHAQRPVATRLRRGQRLAGAEDPHRPRQGRRRSVSTSSTCSTTATRSATARGVGVGAPQFGQRRTFLLGLAQKF